MGGLHSTSSRPASARRCASGSSGAAVNRAVQGVVPSGVGAGESRSARRADGVLDREPSQRGEDTSRHLGEVVQLDVFVGDARLVLQPGHDRVVQVPLGGEVPVDGALADAGAFGDGPEGQLVPVPGGESVDQSVPASTMRSRVAAAFGAARGCGTGAAVTGLTR